MSCLMETGGSIHKDSPIIPILSQFNPFLILIPIYLRIILILSSHQSLGLPKGLFPIGLPDRILKALLPSIILIYDLPILILMSLTILESIYLYFPPSSQLGRRWKIKVN